MGGDNCKISGRQSKDDDGDELKTEEERLVLYVLFSSF